MIKYPFKTYLLTAFTIIFPLLCHQALADHSAAPEIIKIHGSSTVHNFVFNKYLDEFQQGLGFTLNVVPSSSGRGMLALIEGKADMAMISSDLPSIIAKLAELQALKIKADDYKVYNISRTRVLFITHPDNPIKALSKDQINALFTGDIKDWSQLGLNDLGEVKVVTEHPTGGVYTTVLNKVTHGAPLTDNKIIMQNGPQTALVVSQIPGGFGMMSDATPDEQRRKVSVLNTPDFDTVQNLYFVINKDEHRDSIFKIITFIQERFKP